MLTAVLTVSMTGEAWAESAAPDRPEPAATAISEELELLKEEETVSIASRYEQPISEAPANVYVITDEDIRQSGSPDLPTILRRIPGLEVIQMSGAEFNVSFRGDNQVGANKVLVLVDGRSAYADIQGSLAGWRIFQITLPEIKRIEVLKGPAAAIYGFNAFDGVVNIITKSPDEMRGTTLQFGGGEYGTISSAAIHADTVGQFGYRLSVGREQTQQWRNSKALAFRAHKFNVHTQYALSNDSKLTVQGGLMDSNRFDGTISGTISQGTRPAQGYANVAYERPSFFLRAWWTEFTDVPDLAVNPMLSNFLRLSNRSGGTDFPITTNTYNIESQHMLELGAFGRLTYGANYRHNTVSSSFFDQFTREDRFGLYVQNEWRATTSLTITAGVRYDLDTFIHPTISPRVFLNYRLTNEHSLHASFSVGYRPPTLFESHAALISTTTLPPPIPSLAPSPVRGSANLNPEQIVSYEVGYQGWFLRHRLRARADLFFNHLSDLIRNGGGAAGEFINGAEADIYGGEAGIELLATSWLSGFTNFSYEEIGQTLAGEFRRGAPRFKFNAGMRGEWSNGLSSELLFYHVGAAEYPVSDAFASFARLPGANVTVPNPRVGSYNLLNLRAGYRFWQQKAAAGYMRDAEVAVSVFNALNDEHKEHPLGELFGRRVMGWVTVRF
ncbi:MAG: TonB-dependent receptor [Nitrospira sp.]|nr:TonB-dependent receptor [Nitrospira sp.]